MVKELTKEEFEENVLKAKKPVMLKFFGSNCPACVMFAPVYEELSEENPHIDFYQVHAEEQHELATEYDLMSIPTVLFFHKGEFLDRFSGMISKEKVVSMFEGLDEKSNTKGIFKALWKK